MLVWYKVAITSLSTISDWQEVINIKFLLFSYHPKGAGRGIVRHGPRIDVPGMCLDL